MVTANEVSLSLPPLCTAVMKALLSLLTTSSLTWGLSSYQRAIPTLRSLQQARLTERVR